MNQIARVKTDGATPVDTFAEAFVKLQAAIKPAIKDANNPAFRSKYADLGAVWEAIKGPLTDNGFSIIQSPNFEGETMWLETIVLHISGDKMTGRYPLRPTKQDPQGFGSALTYARRYSISAMLGVIADEDDDGNAASRPAAPRPTHVAALPPDPQPAQFDPDPDGQASNWVNTQKAFITSAPDLPAIYEWVEKYCGEGPEVSIAMPHSGSVIARLKSKSPTLFKELVTHYQTKVTELGRATF